MTVLNGAAYCDKHQHQTQAPTAGALSHCSTPRTFRVQIDDLQIDDLQIDDLQIDDLDPILLL